MFKTKQYLTTKKNNNNFIKDYEEFKRIKMQIIFDKFLENVRLYPDNYWFDIINKLDRFMKNNLHGKLIFPEGKIRKEIILHFIENFKIFNSIILVKTEEDYLFFKNRIINNIVEKYESAIKYENHDFHYVFYYDYSKTFISGSSAYNCVDLFNSSKKIFIGNIDNKYFSIKERNKLYGNIACEFEQIPNPEINYKF